MSDWSELPGSAGAENITSSTMWNILTAMILSAEKNIVQDIFKS